MLRQFNNGVSNVCTRELIRRVVQLLRLVGFNQQSCMIGYGSNEEDQRYEGGDVGNSCLLCDVGFEIIQANSS